MQPGSTSDDDAVFKALNDQGRRRLLDKLFNEDGQTLSQLCEHLPRMTRYGVMNHVNVLEAAGLVTAVRDGRKKHHYINPVPIRRVKDSWISKFTAPVIINLAELAGQSETDNTETNLLGGESQMPLPTHRYQTFIRCSVEDAWTAITDGKHTAQYFYRTTVDSSFAEGEPIRYLTEGGEVVADGEVLTCDPPHRLEMTFLPRWDPVLTDEGPAHMAWLVEYVDGLTRVTVEYYDLPLDSKRASAFMEGIPLIVSGMKTLLESGTPLAV